MLRISKLAITAAVAAQVLGAPAMAFDFDDLMKIKKELENVREYVRKLRGREPAPPPPAPPTAQTPPPGQAPASGPAPASGAGGLNLAGNCVAKDEAGYVENAQINVAGGAVRHLAAHIDVPNHGSCRYQLAAFRQTKQTPFIELLARSNENCALRMWQQGDRITFAATDCADKCTRGAFDYAWPVEFNTAGGCH